MIDAYAVKGSTNFFNEWKELGNKIICTGMPRKSGKRTYLDEFKIDNHKQKVILVIGSEGEGVSPHLMAMADETIMIRKLGSD